MRKSIILIGATLLCSTFLFSQSANDEYEDTHIDMGKGTTLDEYLYLKKGLKVQKESGLDPLKEGYYVASNFLSSWYNGLQFEFISLTKKEEEKPVAIGVLVKEESGDITHTFCLPRPSSDESVLKKYKKSMERDIYFGVDKIAFNNALAEYLIYLVTWSQK